MSYTGSAPVDEWIRQAELWGRQAEAWIRQQPPEQIYVAAAVVAITILVLVVGTVPNLECFLPCIERRVLECFIANILGRCRIEIHRCVQFCYRGLLGGPKSVGAIG
jgi:hypothetical protein